MDGYMELQYKWVKWLNVRQSMIGQKLNWMVSLFGYTLFVNNGAGAPMETRELKLSNWSGNLIYDSGHGAIHMNAAW
jgi:hypothetical protein